MSFLSGDSNPGPNSSAFMLSPDILYPATLSLLLSLCLKTLQNKKTTYQMGENICKIKRWPSKWENIFENHVFT